MDERVVLDQIYAAGSAEGAREIERRHLVQTDNRPHGGDPEDQP